MDALSVNEGLAKIRMIFQESRALREDGKVTPYVDGQISHAICQILVGLGHEDVAQSIQSIIMRED